MVEAIWALPILLHRSWIRYLPLTGWVPPSLMNPKWRRTLGVAVQAAADAGDEEGVAPPPPPLGEAAVRLGRLIRVTWPLSRGRGR